MRSKLANAIVPGVHPDCIQVPAAILRVCILFEQITHSKEYGGVFMDHTGQRRNGHFAISEGVERVDALVHRYTGGQMNEDLDLLCRIVFDLLDLDLPLVIGLEHRIDQTSSGRAERDLCNAQHAVTSVLDPGAYPDLASFHSIVVLRNVRHSTRGEIWEQLESLARLRMAMDASIVH